MRAFVVTYDQSMISQEEFISRIDNMRSVTNWMIVLPGTIFIVTDEDAKSIANLIREIDAKLRFFVGEVDPHRKSGFLPRAAWDLINEPRPAKADA